MSLGPLEDLLEGWDLRHEVPLHFAFPSNAALDAVELVLRLAGELVVVQLLFWIVQQA